MYLDHTFGLKTFAQRIGKLSQKVKSPIVPYFGITDILLCILVLYFKVCSLIFCFGYMLANRQVFDIRCNHGHNDIKRLLMVVSATVTAISYLFFGRT